ncbi:NAD-dependent epimerase/dehydratase family protein [Rhodobacter sphaeroides]|jgi:Nucleoside-diphosphate-sugar epimerases|uniref:NAD-dependent epimerase/dehydratase n=1 Tax=Cereibacter sphaeroides (strain ATCC 17023 / DSM 158 / JCM 6121 / CCUG 31486 / LMG 2827 / NBRC 12203 / NCIMB 8253 / ATH 2.4.1.) TaxID=272943 RepID=Q3J0J3_CERS4|nr:NAD-dependent epimerase/dehydratase family protein [Cereibacter sphaeroides]ABA79691.1 NAD-dependent epimerase/dehydratase [Cereibacter sphaeroides 2.4.1]AMJ47977.1 NAD-dependent dehydratase [Cereibacter sphaeroides]ANS34686.1 NAD-dependent dehydratase [Cereibacter sphaeroides]ATN63734.1 NAD-dependent dehydratase [Cereibacter sphaeroides]AXC61903.1 NAD-dependent dehydratase [Cereibacter sphaeroides 2.4.1]
MSRDFGFVEWFRPGDQERVEEALEGLATSGARYLRTHLSWADFVTPGGSDWFDWLIPRLGREIDLLPCIHYTPPSLSRTGRSSGPPRELKSYADFVDHALTRYGRHFSHVELWNEPNNLLDWDWRLDSDFLLFCEMVGGAAWWVRERGWKPVLGGPCPFDPLWLDLMGERGVLAHCAAAGFHGFPGTWDSEESTWGGWDLHLGEMRAILDRHNPACEIWITETGYSTWRNDELEQTRRFAGALKAPADRMYWYGWRDLPRDVPVQEGLWFDPRHYHMGAVVEAGKPKLLARLLSAEGVEGVRSMAGLCAPSLSRAVRPAVITGGAGFIGSNLADALLSDGEEVILLDNLGRAGVEDNLRWLKARHGERLHPVIADLRDERAMADAARDAAAVYHLAGQTAVTTSLESPVADFEINARGTLNLLEAIRATGRPVPLLFASTNKVYGALEDLEMQPGERHVPADPEILAHGIGEGRPLDFCTPYGCSKGVADQYVIDYAKSFGLPTAVLRMSCIYGPRQFGTEDQGWVAHFLIRALKGEGISVFGDGRQVRDVLHVSDAVAAYRRLMAEVSAGRVRSQAFNLGGGPGNAVSLRQVLEEIGRLTGGPVAVTEEDWRQGDQLWFVADTRALGAAIGWSPTVGWREGLAGLAAWLAEHRVGRVPAAEAEPPRARRSA